MVWSVGVQVVSIIYVRSQLAHSVVSLFTWSSWTWTSSHLCELFCWVWHEGQGRKFLVLSLCTQMPTSWIQECCSCIPGQEVHTARNIQHKSCGAGSGGVWQLVHLKLAVCLCWHLQLASWLSWPLCPTHPLHLKGLKQQWWGRLPLLPAHRCLSPDLAL